jgi:uncharacterized protein
MSERSHYPKGVPCWIDTAQPDPVAAVDFYRALLGWEFVGPGQMPGDPPGSYYVAQIRGGDVAGISSQPPGFDAPPSWLTYIATDSADDVVERARRAGATVLMEPFDAPPAGRMAVLADPSGAAFAVWQAQERQGAQVVNEPSAWSMSLLRAPDPEEAKRFYGEVFGWESEPFGPDVTLFRLPGYVGGEPLQPVPRDVVAGLMAGEPGWGVDVWVADAEETAAKASALGGAVHVEPHETPGFRNAVIADPQGAVLSISQLLKSQ